MIFAMELFYTSLTVLLFIDQSYTCTEDEFTCRNGQCIDAGYKCDAESDCADESDEEVELCAKMPCRRPGHFRCGESGRCIPHEWRCDGHPQCPKGSDEKNCETSKCSKVEFQCKENKRCINIRWRCDQDTDCDDATDEIGCTSKPCYGDDFRCSNGRCLPFDWQCDGHNDCGDGSDEANCSLTARGIHWCDEHEFICVSDKECIHAAWKCDGDDDCTDRSDEDPAMCGPLTCDANQFLCANNLSCVAMSVRCDSVRDCGDGSDEEDCAENPCSPFNSSRPCSHQCVRRGKHFVCKCPSGFRLGNDSRTCEDIDECEESRLCSHYCENLNPGYKCKCRPGYEMDLNEHGCRAVGNEPILLFANRHDLRKIHLRSGRYESVVDNLHSAIALDFDFSENYIYWSDDASNTISRREMSNGLNTSNQTQVLAKRNVSTPDGLAFDWIHKNLYWTDRGNNRIEVLTVARRDNFWRKILVNANLDQPRAIVVDPRVNQCYMYWTDCGYVPKIERADLDGSNRISIIEKDIEWPNGLTIDYESNHLYWIDAKLVVIWSSNLVGDGRRIILSSDEYIQHPFAITVFEDYIYWSDWGASSIHRMSKFPKKGRDNAVKSVMMNLLLPMDVRIFHELKQPKGENLCAESGCSHLCLPRRGKVRFTCVCPDNGDAYVLAEDQKTCLSNSSMITRNSYCKTKIGVGVGIGVGCFLIIVVVVVVVLIRKRNSTKVDEIPFLNPNQYTGAIHQGNDTNVHATAMKISEENEMCYNGFDNPDNISPMAGTELEFLNSSHNFNSLDSGSSQQSEKSEFLNCETTKKY